MKLRLIAAFALCAAASAAHADFRMLTQGYANYNAGMNRVINDRTLNKQLARRLGSDTSATDTSVPIASAFAEDERTDRTSVVSLTFSPSAARRRANYDSFVERSRRADPAGAAGLAADLKRDPIAMMEPELAKVGLDTNNVADAYAAYWIEAWEAAHGVTGQTSRQKAQAVRQQAEAAILSTPEFAGSTEAQKQEFAEAFLVQAMLVAAAREQASGDAAMLAQIGRAVEQGASASGLDLRAVVLTEQGFVPARRTGTADPAPDAKPKVLAANREDAGPSYGFLAAAGGAGLGAAFLLGKIMGRKG